MKTTFKALLGLSIVLLSYNSNAQIKIKKPSISLEKPKIDLGGTKSGSDSGNTGILKKTDASGLFTNVTEDPSANHHRKSAVEKLDLLDAENAKASPDYKEVRRISNEINKHLESVLKLEPDVDAAKYNERYAPVKLKAEEDLTVYDEVTKMENDFDLNYRSGSPNETADPLNFRIPQGYRETAPCYCRAWDQTWTYADFTANQEKYHGLTGKLKGYSDDATEKTLTSMATCVASGNKYAAWASKDKLQTEILDYSTKMKPESPNKVIKRCDEYLEALTRIETDPSLNLDAAAKNALVAGKAQVNKTKAESELYISSGEFDIYKEKLATEAAAKVFLPKAVTSSGLESGAKTYISGAEYKAYLVDNLGKSPVTSTLKAVCVSADYHVVKNDLGIPKYQYKEFWVAYKGTDGKCYMAAVYANYTYKGGGTFTTIPNWQADGPERMACENVNK